MVRRMSGPPPTRSVHVGPPPTPSGRPRTSGTPLRGRADPAVRRAPRHPAGRWWVSLAARGRVPQVAVLRDLCLLAIRRAQVSEYRDLWHPAGNGPAFVTRRTCRWPGGDPRGQGIARAARESHEGLANCTRGWRIIRAPRGLRGHLANCTSRSRITRAARGLHEHLANYAGGSRIARAARELPEHLACCTSAS